MIQFLICAAIVEYTCTFFLLHSSNPLYRARRILQYDMQLGWMQKPDLDSTFESQSVMTNHMGFRINSHERTNSPTFITLGPSSAFGWGVKNEETYSSRSAHNLQLTSLNASGIGHSIAQGIRMWDYLKNQITPRYALISYGINDLDKFRFFDSDSVNDREFFQSEPHALKLDKLQLPSDFIVVLSLVIRQISHTITCDQLIRSSQRVEWSDYQKILNTMISEMKSRNIQPILINTPFYLAHPDPKFKVESITEAYAKVSALASKGLCKEAHKELKIAKALEPNSIAQKVISLNESLKKFAEENNIQVIDAYSLLVNQGAKENFYDPVHPSAKGHQLIADQIIKVIQN